MTPMAITIDGNDLLAAVQAQRNDALDDAANNAAAIQALKRKIEELEKRLASASTPAGEA